MITASGCLYEYEFSLGHGRQSSQAGLTFALRYRHKNLFLQRIM